MKIEERVFSYIEEYNMIETGSHVTVGISGGADSVCLLFLLKRYQKQRTFSLCGVHVNHQLREEEALRDEAFSRTFCENLHIPFQSVCYPVGEIAEKRKLSVEEAGRLVRRQAFRELGAQMGEGKKQVIALAHHENDNAETVLHNLIRGSGAAGLGGIRPIQAEGQQTYIRPLLCISRQELETFLKAQGLTWVTDSTNLEARYTRNKIRHQVLPKLQEINPKACAHIAEAAEVLRKIEEYLQVQAGILYKEYVSEQKNGVWIAEALFREKEIMQSYVLLKALKNVSKHQQNLTAVHVETVRALALGRTGAQASLPYGLTAYQSYGRTFIGKPETGSEPLLALEFEIFPYENQQIPEKTYTKWFDYDKIKGNPIIRHREQGDFFVVNALGGKKKVKDYFIDSKIPRQEREKITLLADGTHIIWIVGYRISEFYKVTNQTKRILKVQVKGENE